MALTYHELTNLSFEELIQRYDKTAQQTSIGLNYYTEEIARRRSEKSEKLMLTYTKWITIMTGVMLLCTIINVFF
jgi:hypothetical protein